MKFKINKKEFIVWLLEVITLGIVANLMMNQKEMVWRTPGTLIFAALWVYIMIVIAVLFVVVTVTIVYRQLGLDSTNAREKSMLWFNALMLKSVVVYSTVWIKYCKECGSEVRSKDEVSGYAGIFECNSCKHPHLFGELFDEVPCYIENIKS